MLRELLLPEGGLASAQDADTDGVEGLTFTWTEEEGAPAELLEPFEHGRSIIRGELDEATRVAAARDPRAAAEAAARRQGDRVVERACARGARGGRAAARAAGLDRGGAPAGRLPPRPALGSGRTAAAQLPRRAAPAATGYLDDYANVAHGLLELHVATGELRWLREAHRLALLAVELFGDERARRLLPLARRRRAAGRADEGARRPPAPVRQLDARARAAPARADLRRRRARAQRRLRAPAAPARARAGAVVVRLGARRARPASEPAAASSRSSVRSARTSPARRSSRGSRGRSWRSGRPRTCRCWRARTWSAGARGLRLRAFCVPRADHRSGPHLTRMCQVA